MPKLSAGITGSGGVARAEPRTLPSLPMSVRPRHAAIGLARGCTFNGHSPSPPAAIVSANPEINLKSLDNWLIPAAGLTLKTSGKRVSPARECFWSVCVTMSVKVTSNLRPDGLPKVILALGILGLTTLFANLQVTRVHPTVPVYQIQLLGHIMLVCPETFDRSSDAIDCERWLRRTRGGTTVFVQPMLLPEETQEEDGAFSLPLPKLHSASDLSNTRPVAYRLRPRPRPDSLAE